MICNKRKIKIIPDRPIRKKITGSLTIIWMIVIFAFSAQPATQSSQVSGGIAYKLAKLQNDFLRLDKTEAELSTQAESMQLIIRKGAHMGEYALLAILLCLYFSCSSTCKRQLVLLSLSITTGYAATDEIHQLFVPGRAGRLSDICIDALGGMIGLILCLIILHFRHKHSKSAAKKEKR